MFLFIAVVTLFGGSLMKIYAWRTILGTEGVLNTALIGAGLIDQPITVLLFSPPAVVLTLIHFLLPFAILPVYAALRGIADIEIEAARDLGAPPWKILRDVVVPRARSGLVAAFALCLLVAIGDYVTPILVGGTMSMYGQMIAPTFGNFMNWPLGAAMSITILVVALLLVLLANALLARIGRPS